MNGKGKNFSTTFLIISVIFIVYIIMVFVAFGGLNFLPSEIIGPSPQVQYAEFPFELVYKVDNEIFVVEDVLTGKFLRNNYHMGLGKVERVWKAELKSGNKYVSLYSDNKIEIFYQPTKDPNIIKTFMGEETVYNIEKLLKYPVSLVIKEGKKERFTSFQELKEVYKIQLISWKISPPIKNSFG